MALIMGGTGLLTTQMNNSRQADAQRSNALSAAAQTQFSPYTKMGAGSFQAKPLQSEVGGALQGGISGLQLSQSYNKAQSDQDLAKAQANGMSNNQMNQYVNQVGSNPYVMSYDSYNKGRVS